MGPTGKTSLDHDPLETPLMKGGGLKDHEVVLLGSAACRLCEAVLAHWLNGARKNASPLELFTRKTAEKKGEGAMHMMMSHGDTCMSKAGDAQTKCLHT